MRELKPRASEVTLEFGWGHGRGEEGTKGERNNRGRRGAQSEIIYLFSYGIVKFVADYRGDVALFVRLCHFNIAAMRNLGNVE